MFMSIKSGIKNFATFLELLYILFRVCLTIVTLYKNFIFTLRFDFENSKKKTYKILFSFKFDIDLT